MNNVKKVSKIWLSGFMGIALMTLTITGCLDDDSPARPNFPVAFVSIYNGSPNGPDLDIQVDNKQINPTPFEYGDFSGYLRFYTGDRNLKFGPAEASSVNIDTTVTFERNKVYSVFVVDEYENASVVVLTDNSDLPAEGKAKVRVIHLSPDAPEIDVAIEGETGVIADNLSFKETSSIVEVDADELTFKVLSADGSEVLLTVPSINLQSRGYYTIIVRGYATPPDGNPNVLSAQIVRN
jgi:hypothetical protein